MNADLISVLEYWEREKEIPRNQLIEAVQGGLLLAAKKAVGPARELRVIIDPKNGDIKAFARLLVAERVLSKHDQIALSEARKLKADVQIGEEIEAEVTPAGFGRIAAQYAKQAIMQLLRKMEKERILSEFKDRVGDIIGGTVRRFERSDVWIDLGKYEALLPNRERVPTEEYQIGERINCYVKAVENTPHGPEIILSRADNNFVVKLLRREVAELADGTIEIKGIAREPGFRTKIAVYSRDSRVDPVGACVGLKGQRVKNIVRELNNEKVDIFRWSPNIRELLMEALKPAILKQFEIDEPNRRVHVLVGEDQLAIALGKRGQNARLTSRLAGWHVEIDAERVENTAFEAKVTAAVNALAGVAGITGDQAKVLVNAGVHSLEDLLQAEATDLADIPGIGDQAGVILEAARAEAARRTFRLGDASPAA